MGKVQTDYMWGDVQKVYFALSETQNQCTLVNNLFTRILFRSLSVVSTATNDGSMTTTPEHDNLHNATTLASTSATDGVAPQHASMWVTDLSKRVVTLSVYSNVSVFSLEDFGCIEIWDPVELSWSSVFWSRKEGMNIAERVVLQCHFSCDVAVNWWWRDLDTPQWCFVRLYSRDVFLISTHFRCLRVYFSKWHVCWFPSVQSPGVNRATIWTCAKCPMMA